MMSKKKGQFLPFGPLCLSLQCNHRESRLIVPSKLLICHLVM